MPIDRATLGPVEVLAVAFQGGEFKGEIIAALRQLIDGGTIRVLDLAFVRKETDGRVTTARAGELEGTDVQSLAALADGGSGLVRDADLEDAANSLEPGNAAAILVWEDSWAIGLVDAIRAANGAVLSLERVPKDAVDELLDSLAG